MIIIISWLPSLLLFAKLAKEIVLKCHTLISKFPRRVVHQFFHIFSLILQTNENNGKTLNKCQNKIDRKHFAISFVNKLLSKENSKSYQ